MKANYFGNKSQAMRIAKAAAREQEEELWDKAYAKAAADVSQQITATHLYILASVFGFGETRLKRFLEGCNSVNSLMMSEEGVLGKRVTPDDVIAYMEEKYHLDLSLQEIKIESEDKRK